jgi:hypothetical protein
MEEVFGGSRAGGPGREEQLWIDAAARGALTPVHVCTIPSAAPDRERMSRWPAPWPAVRRACRATAGKCAIEDQSTRVGRRMEGVRRPPDQTCDRCGPAVRAAYGAAASSISAALREPVLAWLAGEDVLAPQPAEGNRHDR